MTKCLLFTLIFQFVLVTAVANQALTKNAPGDMPGKKDRSLIEGGPNTGHSGCMVRQADGNVVWLSTTKVYDSYDEYNCDAVWNASKECSIAENYLGITNDGYICMVPGESKAYTVNYIIGDKPNLGIIVLIDSKTNEHFSLTITKEKVEIPSIYNKRKVIDALKIKAVKGTDGAEFKFTQVSK